MKDHQKIFKFSFGNGLGLRIELGSLSLHLARRSSRMDIDDKVQAKRLIDLMKPLATVNSNIVSEKLISTITISDLTSNANRKQAAVLLNQYGVVVVPNFSKSSLVDNINMRINIILKEYADIITEKEEYEDEYLVLNPEGKSTRFKLYDDYVKCPKTILNLRNVGGDLDNGMIDIFNFDKYPSKEGIELKKLLGGEMVSGVLSLMTNAEWNFYSLNIYVNQGVENTRGFHVDSYGNNQIKVFLYLTDVKDIKDGPYCYVLGSHHDEAIQKLNFKLSDVLNNRNHTDCFLVDTAKILPMIADKGTLIISDQSGAHRGIPQASNSKRILAVMNFIRVP